MTFEELTNWTLKPIVQSDTTVYNPPLKAIDILAAGDLAVIDSEGTAATITFPAVAAGGSYPHRWVCRVRQVLDTGTTLTDAQMVGLH